MGEKKRGEMEKICCHHCETEFDNDKLLVQHQQQANHFKRTCTHGAHQVQLMEQVLNTETGRDSMDIESYRMEGTLPDIVTVNCGKEAPKPGDSHLYASDLSSDGASVRQPPIIADKAKPTDLLGENLDQAKPINIDIACREYGEENNGMSTVISGHIFHNNPRPSLENEERFSAVHTDISSSVISGLKGDAFGVINKDSNLPIITTDGLHMGSIEENKDIPTVTAPLPSLDNEELSALVDTEPSSLASSDLKDPAFHYSEDNNSLPLDNDEQSSPAEVDPSSSISSGCDGASKVINEDSNLPIINMDEVYIESEEENSKIPRVSFLPSLDSEKQSAVVATEPSSLIVSDLKDGASQGLKESRSLPLDNEERSSSEYPDPSSSVISGSDGGSCGIMSKYNNLPTITTDGLGVISGEEENIIPPVTSPLSSSDNEDQSALVATEPSSQVVINLKDVASQVVDGNCSLPLDRGFVGSTRKKLLVLDLNGLLVDILSYVPYDYDPDAIMLKKAVFKRPFCGDFLDFCFEKFEVGIWSSRSKRTVEPVTDFLLGADRKKLLFCWDQSHCTNSGFHTVENWKKPLILKKLKKLWEKFEPDLPWEVGAYDESNTLLLDDSPCKAICNPPYTAIFPETYKFRNVEDHSLGQGGDLRVYLEGLAEAENVQEYVKQNPFGQRPITENNLSWGYYLRVIKASSSPPNATGNS